MTLRTGMRRILEQEDLNFLLTNRIPRRLCGRLVGWFSHIEQPLVRNLSIGLWRLFSDLDLSEARTTQFRSLHDCFVRQLRDGARPIDGDAGLLVSPCDAIVGAHGKVSGTDLFQIKGFRYTLQDLLRDDALVEAYCDGRYATLRLRSNMYHRFHAPHDCCVDQVTYIPGDAWNVNPATLRRVQNLYCKNERAILRTTLSIGGHVVTLVPVAAILVAGIRLHFLDVERRLKQDGPGDFACSAVFGKGEEMGWFEHGSTIIVFAPDGFALCDNVREGGMIRVGQPLMRLP
jgi:phosphatidylserine decarboxylase